MLQEEPQARSFQSQGLTLNYWDWGNPGAPLLALVHGSRDHARAWDWTARALRAQYHVVAPDLRGHGDSGWSPDGAYMTPYYVMDFVNLIDNLVADEVTLIGHSFGGAVTMRYAALFPGHVKKLAIVDGMGPAPHVRAKWERDGGPLARTREWIGTRLDAAERPQKLFFSIEEGAQRLRREQKRLSEEQALHLAKHGLRPEGEGYIWKYDPMMMAFLIEDFALETDEVRAAVTAPVLLFWGPESWTTHPDEDGRAAQLRDHRVIKYDEAGHWLHHDRFDDFIAELKAFLV
jgi:pimeloyl-ACP methyl ester carboxylesterase